ncbi:MAG: hypothetical protein HY704_14130 [Gemmatimonadetes bacterium]|nr:hypothetical protein [Gemmatimonadota bacterium]
MPLHRGQLERTQNRSTSPVTPLRIPVNLGELQMVDDAVRLERGRPDQQPFRLVPPGLRQDSR